MSPEDLAGLPSVAQLMVRLCEIPSPSRDEGAVAEAVRAHLHALGAEIHEDGAAQAIGAGCGNIVARFPATGGDGVPIMFAAHLDTVPVTGPIEVELVDGELTNRHPVILGGDNKAAVAVMLEAMRRVVAEERPHAGVELVFTPCEEIGLRGAAAFDPTPLNARFGFVYDHTGPVGHVVGSAPSLHRIEATFVGRAAHAGITPESGAAPSWPPPAPSPGCRWGGSTPRRPPTSAPWPAAPPPTWWPSAARSRPRPAAAASARCRFS